MKNVILIGLLFMTSVSFWTAGCGEEASQQDVQNAVDNMINAMKSKATECGYTAGDFTITCGAATQGDVTDLNNCAQSIRNLTCEALAPILDDGDTVPGCEAADELCTFGA